MSGLPEHRKDLEELRAEIDAKLAALSKETPIQLAVTGEWIETFGRKCVMPEGVTKKNTKGEWQNEWGHTVPLNSFDTGLWHFPGIKAIRLTRLAPVLNLDGETVINHYNGLIKLPDNIGDYEFQWEAHGNSLEWSDGLHLQNWDENSWCHVKVMKIRKKLPKEQKVKFEVEFTTYVQGVSKILLSNLYLAKTRDGAITLAPGYAISNSNVTHYYHIGPRVF